MSEEKLALWKQMQKDKKIEWAAMFDALSGMEDWSISDLWEGDDIPGFREDSGQARPRLALHRPHEGGARGLILICAGGSFLFKSAHEALPVADYFYQAGLNTAILDYRVQPYTKADSVCDGIRALRRLRRNAAALSLSPDHIAIGGFSAGGMLAGLVGVTYDDPEFSDARYAGISGRPDAVCQWYGSFSPNTGIELPTENYHIEKQAEIYRASPNLRVSPQTPPHFLFGLSCDDPRYVLQMAGSLAENGVPFELHTFARGCHGGGLYDGKSPAPNEPHTATWASLCTEWLLGRGW